MFEPARVNTQPAQMFPIRYLQMGYLQLRFEQHSKSNLLRLLRRTELDSPASTIQMIPRRPRTVRQTRTERQAIATHRRIWFQKNVRSQLVSYLKRDRGIKEAANK